MKICLTGATGFIGRRFAELALQAGHEVWCLVRSRESAKRLPPAAEIHVGDVAELHGLEGFVRGADAVVHLAAAVGHVSDAEYMATNVVGSRNICQAIAKHNKDCLLIYCSSIAVLRRHQRFTWLNTKYTNSKTLAEQQVRQQERENGLRVAYLYPGMVYGPGDGRFFPTLIRALKAGRLVKVTGGEKNAPLVYVDDVCDLISHLLETPSAAGRQFIAVGRQELGMHQLCERVALETGGRQPGWLVPKSMALGLVLVCESLPEFLRKRLSPFLSRRVVDVLSINLDPKRVAEANGNEWLAKHSDDEGLALTFRWLREEGLA